MNIGVIDYGLCNMHSIFNAIKFLNHEPCFINNADEIENYKKILLPGVGSFQDGMRGLINNNYNEKIIEYINSEGHFLGICLGMQMMLSKSYEFGLYDGLGLVKGNVVKIPSITNEVEHKIPHLGWNRLVITDNAGVNLAQNGDYVYFVHSFMAKCDEEYVQAYTNYNDINIPAIIKYKNSYGCQFHPEKSGKLGLNILKNFINL